jgi:autotransporter-associated beta strand protein
MACGVGGREVSVGFSPTGRVLGGAHSVYWFGFGRNRRNSRKTYMKTNTNRNPRILPAISFTIACLAFWAAALPSRAASFTWDGTTNTWPSVHWYNSSNTLVAGGTVVTDFYVITNGRVTFAANDTFGQANTTASPAITIGGSGTIASGAFFNTFWNLTLQGGTLLPSGGVNASFPAFQLDGTLTVSGTSPSIISAGSGSFPQVNIGGNNTSSNTLTMDVADVTGNANPDLTIAAVLKNGRNPNVAGHVLKTGPGTLVLSGNNLYTGNTIVSAGLLQLSGGRLAGGQVIVNAGATLGGVGSIGGPLTVNGTLAPGAAIGSLTVSNAVALSGNTVMEIQKTGSALTNDRLLVVGQLTQGGMLTVIATGDSLAVGDSFDLFDATTMAGGFTNLALPALLGELSWGTQNLAVDGSIIVLRTVGPPGVVRQPVGSTNAVGSAQSLSVVVSGAMPFRYQWLKDGSTILNATNAALDFPSLSLADSGSYQVVVTNVSGAVTSSPAILAVATLPDKLVQYQNEVRNELFLFSSYPFDLRTASDAVGPNHGTLRGTAWFGSGMAGGVSQALLLDGGGHVSLGTPADFAFGTGKGGIEAWIRADWLVSPGYSPCLFANRDGTPTRWSIHMTPTKDQLLFWNGAVLSSVAIPVAGTNWHMLTLSFDATNWTVYWDGQTVRTSPEPFGTTMGLPTQIGSSANATTAEGWIGALDEVSFFSDVLSLDQVSTHYLAFTAGDPPWIQTQPQGGLFFIGSQFALSAFASGNALRYQWYKGGTALAGATNNAIQFPSLTSADSGDYQVLVTNAASRATSAVARLDVRVPDTLRYQQIVRSEPSLISFYPFDSGTAGDVVSTNQGTWGGTTAFAPGLGGVGDQALVVTGAGYVGLGRVSEFDFSDGTGTVEAWLRADWNPATPPAYNPTIFAERNGTPTRWSIHMTADKARLAFWNGSVVSYVSIPASGTNWHLFTCVFDTGSWRVYWDGQAVVTNAIPLGSGANLATQIGSSSSTSATEAWVGAFNEVAFYRDALNGSQAWNHYSAMIDPALHYSRSGSSLTVSWPADLAGFTLESAGQLPAASWIPVPGVVNNSVTVDASAGTRFYRLRR